MLYLKSLPIKISKILSYDSKIYARKDILLGFLLKVLLFYLLNFLYIIQLKLIFGCSLLRVDVKIHFQWISS